MPGEPTLSAMSEIFAAQLTAVANAVLAAFAIVTAGLAFLAWRKQSREVSDQAEMLGLQRRQLEAQREDSARQAGVLELQAADLRESLKERERDAQERREGQAASVAAWFAEGQPLAWGDDPWGATARNASALPVYDIRAGFYCIDEPVRGLGWTSVACGTSTEMLRVLPPGETYHFFIPLDVRSQRTECSADVYAVGITFTDAAGNRWERDPRGTLKPLS